MSGEPKTLTLEEALEKGLLAHRLSFTEGDDGGAFRLVDALSIGVPTIEKGRREIMLLAESLAEAVRALGVPVVARDDAAELKAQFHEWWSAYVNVASRLGMTSVDDAGRLGAVATAEEINAEITRRERNAAELRAALKQLLEAVEGDGTLWGLLNMVDGYYNSCLGEADDAVERARAALAAAEGQP